MHPHLPEDFKLTGLINQTLDNAPSSLSFFIDAGNFSFQNRLIDTDVSSVGPLVPAPPLDVGTARSHTSHGKITAELWTSFGRPVDVFLLQSHVGNFYYVYVEDTESGDKLYYYPIVTGKTVHCGALLASA